jgi:hypothetical protein
MTSRALPGHLFALFLLIYITADLIDPFTPGVFCFENDDLFVDSVVEHKSHVPAPSVLTAPLPTPSAIVRDDVPNTAAKVRISAPLRPQHLRWKSLKRDDSASFGSLSPSDASPTSHQS